MAIGAACSVALTYGPKRSFTQLIQLVTSYSDLEWLFIDGSIVRAQQHGTGATTDSNEAIGKSRGSNSTKIYLAVGCYGLPVHFELSGGQVRDIVHAEKLIDESPIFNYVVGDKGYDSEKFRVKLCEYCCLRILYYVASDALLSNF